MGGISEIIEKIGVKSYKVEWDPTRSMDVSWRVHECMLHECVMDTSRMIHGRFMDDSWLVSKIESG